MNNILQKIVSHKRQEIVAAQEAQGLSELKKLAQAMPAPRDFCGAIRENPRISLIAEVKKASPSKGVIRENFLPVEIAKAYASAGARCISVLTDQKFFQGHLDYLRQIRQQVDVPLLCKDFILDEYQIVQARVAGADAVLLIAECLAASELQRLHAMILEWQMIPLVEFYDAENLPAVMSCRPRLVGVNNRNLATFAVDLQHSIRLRQAVPPEVLFVSESGISTRDDVTRLEANGVNAMLVGESLMRQADIGQAVRQLLGPASIGTPQS